ncbi:40S ribosomal protein S21-like [Orcinus orca]|uniref:40S ribosomal protein S21-like n=1 Tax=Orcinus orca TaxID=9733 RepID=UPI0021135DBB|nr:40S ribosomal protein S21-like [Orcinus orca]XP_059993357.1 small ribosomal subunit protein eS21-like [Lagenorhynchus albirostris]XP_060148053.1 small ribosomal subunit protein eS21-like [Globicephala melas]
MQNDDFVDLYAPHNRISGSKDHASVQTNLAELDKVTARFNGQFKTYSICRAIHRMGESEDSILQLAKADGISQRTPDWRGSWMWNICHK